MNSPYSQRGGRITSFTLEVLGKFEEGVVEFVLWIALADVIWQGSYSFSDE